MLQSRCYLTLYVGLLASKLAIAVGLYTLTVGLSVCKRIRRLVGCCLTVKLALEVGVRFFSVVELTLEVGL